MQGTSTGNAASQTPDLTRSNLHLEADDLLGDDGEATTDGSHPTDLGFVRQAAAFERSLRKVLKR